ncbi:MAG: hypothetical protein ACKVQS_10305 [Fimbriimonadaceae bacterium]
MKRWLPWLIVPLVFSVWVVLIRATGNGLLLDSDTKVLLMNIQERGNPWSWFAGDWPLFNHFYRPISTLFFEMDLRFYGMVGSGFGMTNALICAVCVWLSFWVGRELTDKPLTAALGTLVFGIAHVKLAALSSVFGWIWVLAVLSLFGLFRGKLRDQWWTVGLAFLGCLFLASLVPGPLDFKTRIVDWLPGRTASVMAIFGLISVASYARFERLTAVGKSFELTSTDLPATKGTVVTRASRFAWIWVVVSALGLVLALGAYEQAVVIPALITGVMILFSLQGRRVHWANLVLFWGILVGYLLLRRVLVPSDVSGYQAQQFRTGGGVINDLILYLAPGLQNWSIFSGSFEVGVLAFLTSIPWVSGALIFGNVTSMVGVWRDRNRWLGFGFLLMGFVAFLPMGWLKFFAHYHYFPAVFYSLFLVVFGQMVLGWVVESVSPSRVLAPAREG